MSMSKHEFLVRSGLEEQTLDVWLEEQWLLPDRTSAELNFSDIDIARVQLIRDLQTGLGVNDEGVGVILHLVDQLHGLRRALGDLHMQFPGPHDKAWSLNLRPLRNFDQFRRQERYRPAAGEFKR